MLAKRIAALREARGWSQPRLAELAGVDQGTIWRLESGAARRPTWDTISAIVGALGVSTDALKDPDAFRAAFEELNRQRCQEIMERAGIEQAASFRPAMMAMAAS